MPDEQTIGAALLAYLRYRASDGAVHVRMNWCSAWVVAWMDFSTVKQDPEFGTEREARAYAQAVRYGPVEPPISDIADTDLSVYCDYWLGLGR